MPMIAPFTLVMDIDRLDHDTAEFRHTNPSSADSLGVLELARSEWQDLGRPARLYVSVTDREPNP